jgi:lactose/L-arabinose transport system substrate-binding protein
MISKHSIFRLVSLMIIAIMGLTACGPAETPTPEVIIMTEIVEKEGETIVEVVTATPEPVVEVEKPKGDLVLWGWSYDVFQTPGLFDEFQEEYPDITLEVVTYSSGDTYQNLQLALSAGSGGPDIVQIENSRLAGFVRMGGLLDMTEWVTPYIDIMNDYKWADAELDGKYYAMPWDSGPVVMYYRRDVFEQAGLPTSPDEVSALVATWDGYLDVCKTIKEETGRDCFAHNKANNFGRLYEMALWQQGLGYYNDAGEVTVDSPENIATLEKFGEFWDAEVCSDQLEWTDGWYAEMNSLDEPIATLVEASWMGVFLKSWIAGDTAGRWGVAYMPAMEEGQVRASNDGGSTLAILEQSENKEAAWAFVDYMLGRKESALRSFAYSDFLPALETTYDDHLFIEPDSFFGGQVARQIYLDVAKMIPVAYVYGPDYQLMNGYVNTAVQNFALGEMSAEEALTEAADEIRAQTGMP